MRFLFLPTLVLCGSIGFAADAGQLRHNNIRNLNRQIQQLPALNPQYVVPKPVYVAPAPLDTVDNLPQVEGEAVQPAPLRSVASLSPKTQSLIDEVKPGIGAENSAPKKIVIKAGGFDDTPKEVAEVDESGFEEVGSEVETTPAFEVRVTEKAPAFVPHENLAKAERAMKFEQYESAVALYRAVLAENPKNVEAKFGVATAYQKMGRKNRSKEVYGEILAKNPRYEPAVNNLLALAASEAPERALEEFAEIQEKSPNFAAVYAQKARVYRDQLNLGLAVKNLRQALEIEPDNNVYRYDLAILEDERGGYAEAAALYAELVTAANDGEEIPADKELIADRMNYVSSIQ